MQKNEKHFVFIYLRQSEDFNAKRHSKDRVEQCKNWNAKKGNISVFRIRFGEKKIWKQKIAKKRQLVQRKKVKQKSETFSFLIAFMSM